MPRKRHVGAAEVKRLHKGVCHKACLGAAGAVSEAENNDREIQVADVPGRCEPGTGEVNYAAVADALRDIGYSGVVGLEAYASDDDVAALERFRSAFTL